MAGPSLLTSSKKVQTRALQGRFIRRTRWHKELSSRSLLKVAHPLQSRKARLQRSRFARLFSTGQEQVWPRFFSRTRYHQTKTEELTLVKYLWASLRDWVVP